MADSSKDRTVLIDGQKTTSRLRYPLRSSGSKQKPDIPSPANASNSAAIKRGRNMSSSVTKSVSGIDISATKPPRRLSVPSKSSTPTSVSKTASCTPPVSHRGTKGSESCIKRRVGNTTPLSDVSKSSSRMKFNTLASRSYWLSHIKHSESAEKHSVSLGFFKLAVDSGCEGLRDELKAYIKKHSLWNMGEAVKEVMNMYNVMESLEEMQVSESCNEAVPTSDDDVNSTSSSSVKGRGGVKPKSLNNINGFHTPTEIQKEKRVLRTSSVRGSSNRNPIPANTKAVKPDMKNNKKSKQNTEESSKKKSPPATTIRDVESKDVENKENVVGDEIEGEKLV